MNETIVIVCGHVFRKERQVGLVLHDSDGIWQFVCGQTDHPEDCGDFAPVGVEHLLERQAGLDGLLTLERGWIAERADAGEWKISPDEPEDDGLT